MYFSLPLAQNDQPDMQTTLEMRHRYSPARHQTLTFNPPSMLRFAWRLLLPNFAANLGCDRQYLRRRTLTAVCLCASAYSSAHLCSLRAGAPARAEVRPSEQEEHKGTRKRTADSDRRQHACLGAAGRDHQTPRFAVERERRLNSGAESEW